MNERDKLQRELVLIERKCQSNYHWKLEVQWCRKSAQLRNYMAEHPDEPTLGRIFVKTIPNIDVLGSGSYYLPYEGALWCPKHYDGTCPDRGPVPGLDHGDLVKIWKIHWFLTKRHQAILAWLWHPSGNLAKKCIETAIGIAELQTS